MAVDGRAIVTQGYWPTIGSELELRIVTQGYVGSMVVVLAGKIKRLGLLFRRILGG
jgi:hypothetical protein